jgi:hypothetical protein
MNEKLIVRLAVSQGANCPDGPLYRSNPSSDDIRADCRL